MTALALLGWVRRVRVGTANPPKIDAVRAVFEAFVPGVVAVEGGAVDSGVPEQPVGFDEIGRGARNRAVAALRAGREAGECELAVGIEDGLVELPELGDATLNIGCAVVTDGALEAYGLSSAFAYPPACAEAAVKHRIPIGGLFDSLWSEMEDEALARPSALDLGNVGRLTHGVLPRSEYARHAVACALVRFLNPELFAREASLRPEPA